MTFLRSPMKLVQLAVCALGLFVVVYYERPSLAAVLLSFPLFCLLGFALALPWVIWGPKYNRRRLARIGDREAIAPKEFYRRFYAGSSLSEDVVVKLLNEVAEAAEVPPGLIRPDDRFDDQITVFQLQQIVFEVSHSDERSKIGSEEGCGFGFLCSLETRARYAISIRFLHPP